MSDDPNSDAHDAEPCAFLQDQDYAAYTPEDQAAWSCRAGRQRALLEGRVVGGFLEGLDRLGIGVDAIPDVTRVNERLQAATGWEVAPVTDRVPPEVFFRLLAARRFPVRCAIRTAPSGGDAEADAFQDLFGRMPLIAQRVYADFLEEYGRAGIEAARHGTVHRLERLYWYTVECGLAQTPLGLRLLGARLVASPEASVFALESDAPDRIAFDLARTMRTRYREEAMQETYFVLDAPDAWPRLDHARLAPLWRALDREPDLEPGEILDRDRVLTRGTGDRRRPTPSGRGEGDSW